MRSFIFGFSPRIENYPFIDTETLYRLVGDNTGNLAFCYAIDKHLGGFKSSILWHAQAKDVDALGDVGVLTLANQLGPHGNYGYLVDGFKKIKASLVGLGLGAQGGNNQDLVDIPQGTLDWIRVIQEHSKSGVPNIGLRGGFTQRCLDRYGLAEKTEVLGCPTLFINPEPLLGKKISERFVLGKKRICVTAGHQKWLHLAGVEQSLVQLASVNSGAYIAQSPLEMVKVGRHEFSRLSEQARNDVRNYVAPWLSEEQFVDFVDNFAKSFFSIDAWLEFLRGFDFVVGTRIHGVMLALQSGIPALCLAHDSRTLELCTTMKVPFVTPSMLKSGRLRVEDIDRFFSDFNYEEFDVNRKALCTRYVRFMKSNSVDIAPYLQTIAAG